MNLFCWSAAPAWSLGRRGGPDGASFAARRGLYRSHTTTFPDPTGNFFLNILSPVNYNFHKEQSLQGLAAVIYGL